MAGLTQRGNVWVATWRNPDGTRTQRTTKIKVNEPGKTRRQPREPAQLVATQMEHLAKGTSPPDKVPDMLRALAEVYGYAKPVPTVAEFFRDYPATAGACAEKDRRAAFARFSEFPGKRVNLPVSKLTADDCRGFLRHPLPPAACRRRNKVDLRSGCQPRHNINLWETRDVRGSRAFLACRAGVQVVI